MQWYAQQIFLIDFGKTKSCPKAPLCILFLVHFSSLMDIRRSGFSMRPARLCPCRQARSQIINLLKIVQANVSLFLKSQKRLLVKFSSVIRKVKSWIKQNIQLLLFISKIHVILYCKVLKVFNFKLFSSFSSFNILFCKSLIDFNGAFIPYNELQYFDCPSIVEHSPARLMYIAHGLVILVHRNIQVITITIGYIQLRQGFEC